MGDDGENATVGLFGKHSSLGDFFQRGMTRDLRSAFDDWLTASLHETREQLGDSWQQVFDAAAPIRFWLGPAALGQDVVAGCMVPSRDQSERRFPLVALVRGRPMAPPVLDPDQSWYSAMEAVLLKAVHDCETSPDDLLVDLRAAETAVAQTEPVMPARSGQFWAYNGDLAATALWQQAAKEDYRRATRERCYVWVDGQQGEGSAVLGCHGLPSGPALAWALAALPGHA
jgi:type VI secretion system ImpM family protein